MVAPRARACDSSSSTSAAAPSPSTRPPRRLSNGLQLAAASAGSAGDSVRKACQAASMPGVSSASAPPATAASARPLRMACIASPIAIAEDEQAVEKLANGPRSPHFTATLEPAALFIAITTDSGRRRKSFLP